MCSKIARKTITRKLQKERMNPKIPLCGPDGNPPPNYGVCFTGPRKQSLKQMRNTFMKGCHTFDTSMIRSLYKVYYPNKK